ncbi:ion transporter [Maricurvus nonylphenolicus]|uniref:ion transporter n=1 Tax=Maricurvus nonylphenolicus TaxID=1008307 RepID=UPI0036F3EF80
MPSVSLKERLNEVIFGTETPAGKLFDMVLITAILLSVVAVMLDSVIWFANLYHLELLWIEWFFTLLFTAEYLTRIYCARNSWQYMRSFYGIVDLISILPTYLALIFTGANYLMIIRLLRVLRIFRILKLVRYLSEANVLVRSMLASRRKIFVFFCTVLVLSTVFGSLMFVVEGPEHGFTSIPKSIYWTIVTITTVGYGDITPQTAIGQVVASMAMLTGYSIIAVPTGILTAELATEMQRERIGRQCRNCRKSGHDRDAEHCKYCGAQLFE